MSSRVGKKRRRRRHDHPFRSGLLRTKDAALYLGMSPGKLRRLTQSGELPIIQHDENSPWLYDLRDLDSIRKRCGVKCRGEKRPQRRLALEAGRKV